MDTTFVEVINISELGGISWYGVSIDSIVSAGIAILVFGLGLLFTRFQTSKSNYNHLLDIQSYLYEVFSEICEGTEERIKAFKALAKHLEREEQADIEMKYTSDYNVRLIKEIEWIDYYSVFSKLKQDDREKSIPIFKKLNNHIAIINDIGELWRESFDELVRRQLEYEKRWNEHITRIGVVINDFVTWAHQNYTPGTNSFIDELDQIISSYQQTPNSRDLYIAKGVLIELLHTLITDNPGESWGRRYLDPVMGCISAYENYTKNKKVFKSQFEGYVEKLASAQKGIASSILELKELKNSEPSIWSPY